MKNVFDSLARHNKSKTLLQSIDGFLRGISNFTAITGSIFAIFVLLMQVRQININNFYISNYDKIINVITICFVFIFIDQIRIAPRRLYIIVSVMQIIGLLLLNFFSKKYYDIYNYRIMWTVAGCALFFIAIIINWFRLSYSKLTLYQMITASFIFAITLGSLLLYLPLSIVDGKINYVDALFTATSAVCVTGLSVIDVSKELTLFGQIVLLILVQIGGLGVMSISAIVLLFSANRGSIQDRVRALEMFNTQNKDIVQSTIKVIFISTFSIELIGALGLFFSFPTPIDKNNIGERIFSSIFHSISAFCNAGFSLYTDSLHRYSANIAINITIMILIILGGIGYPVMLTVFTAFKNKIKGQRYAFDVQARIVIYTSVILIIFGTLFIFFNEYSHSLKDLPLKEKILVSLFQSVSTRTAGFETIAFNSMNSVTIGIVLFLMFVGASPNSTGGGVKTTTLFVFISSVITAVFNRPFIIVNGRKIPNSAVNKSVAIVTLASALTLVSSLIIFYIEKAPAMLPIVFEVISAVATVGLSFGITSSITIWSKLILIVLMFLGRVGYLTLFMSIGSTHQGKYTMIDLPTGEVSIG